MTAARYVAHPRGGAYASGLERNAANHLPLTPLVFLERAADLYPQHLAVIHGALRRTYAELRARSRRLGNALEQRGVLPGDTVAAMLPNSPAMLEAHHGVPMGGAVLNALNTRLDAATLAFILEHGEARALITDTEFAPVMREALARLGRDLLVIDVDDPQGPGGERLGTLDYEALLEEGEADAAPILPADEWQAIALNYTSGTTGNPKGVVYHHRGAYLNAVGNVLVWQMPHLPVYLWTLPMFHCNGWCFPWAVCLQGGTHVCLRKISSESIFAALAEHKVTHLCGAPIIMNMIVNAPEAARRPFDQPVRMMTAASAPPAPVLERMDRLGIEVTHVYGLTEVYGAGHGLRLAARVGRARGRRALAAPGPPGGALPGPGRARRHGALDDDAGAARRGDDGRDHDARPHYDEGLSEEPGGHRGRVRGRLVPHRRPRRHPPRRLCRDPRPLEGHHHLRGREHQLDRGRGGAAPPPRGRRRRGGRQARSDLR